MKAELALAMFILVAAAPVAANPGLIQGEVGLGEQINLGTLQVRPLKIIEDSRCPSGQECPGQNRIIVRTEVRGPASSKVRNFETGGWRQIGRRGALMLVGTTPPPPPAGKIEPEAYHFTFEYRAN